VAASPSLVESTILSRPVQVASSPTDASIDVKAAVAAVAASPSLPKSESIFPQVKLCNLQLIDTSDMTTAASAVAASPSLVESTILSRPVQVAPSPTNAIADVKTAVAAVAAPLRLPKRLAMPGVVSRSSVSAPSPVAKPGSKCSACRVVAPFHVDATEILLEVSGLRERCAGARLAALEVEHEELDEENEGLSTRVEAAEEKIEDLEEEIEGLHLQVDAAEEESVRWCDEVAKLRKVNQELKEQFAFVKQFADGWAKFKKQ